VFDDFGKFGRVLDGDLTCADHLRDQEDVFADAPCERDGRDAVAAAFVGCVQRHSHHDEARSTAAAEPGEFRQDRAIALFIFAAVDEQQPLRVRQSQLDTRSRSGAQSVKKKGVFRGVQNITLQPAPCSFRSRTGDQRLYAPLYSQPACAR